METARLKRAIQEHDVATVQKLMLAEPALHTAPMGYADDGPLTLAAECLALEIADWMIRHGSDVHQGGDAPLMRAALNADRIPMMDLLVKHGADVNARWHGTFPILFAPCETVDPVALEWLLQHGSKPGEALDYLLGSYVRAPEELSACIDLLTCSGAVTKYNVPAVLAILRRDRQHLRQLLKSDAGLITKQFPELDFGTTGGRMLTLRGATLLHVAAEFGNIEACALLLEHGADVGAPAQVTKDDLGGQTPLFHAATQSRDSGLPVVQLLLDRGANKNHRARVPGHYESPGEVLECSALEYAERFAVPDGKTLRLLRAFAI